MIYDYLNGRLFYQFIKYGISSILGIAFLFIANYLFVSVFGLDPRIGYFLAMSLAYVLDYILATVFIFGKDASVNNVTNFIIYTIVFIVINNVSFNIIFHFFDISYLVITAINILIFFPIKFFSQKHFVFRD